MAFKLNDFIFDETDVRKIPDYDEKKLKELYPDCKIHYCKSDGTFKLIEYVNYGDGNRPVIRRSFAHWATFNPIMELLLMENNFVKNKGKQGMLQLSNEEEARQRLEHKKAIQEKSKLAGQMMVDEFWGKKVYAVGGSNNFPILKAKGVLV
jgi:hypothetical protein